MRVKSTTAGIICIAALAACGDDDTGTGGGSAGGGGSASSSSGADATSTASGPTSTASAASTSSTDSASSSDTSSTSTGSGEGGAGEGGAGEGGAGEGGAEPDWDRVGSFSVSWDEPAILEGRFADLRKAGDACAETDARAACILYDCSGTAPPLLDGAPVTFASGDASVDVAPVAGSYSGVYEGAFAAQGADIMLSHLGSADVTAFTLESPVPGHATLLTPAFEELEVVNGAQDIDVTWTVEDGGGTLRFSIYNDDFDQLLRCHFPLEDGMGTVDAELISQLASGPTQQGRMEAVEIGSSSTELGPGFGAYLDVIRAAETEDGGTANTTIFLP